MSQSVASRRQRYWDLRAAGNFIGGGTGAGLIVTAALAGAGGAPFRLALALGLGFLATGLSLVWLEIGKPWRALNVFFHPQTSWMTREGIVAAALVPVGLLAVVSGSAAMAAVAAALAAGFLFCQARMLRAARGIPAWRQAQIVPFILAAGLAEGSGIYLVAGAHNERWLAFALLAGLLREASWLAYRAGLDGTPAAAHSVVVFATSRARLARGVRLVGLALIALALLPAVAGGGAAPVLAWAGGVLTALAGWDVKALLITRAAFTRAVTIPVVPTRGSRRSHA